MLLLLSTLALAGYGDAVDGMPSLAERRTFVWTNAARVDPAAFEDSYRAGGCSFDRDFTDSEKTPKNPVAWSADLNEAARFHSTDMFDNDHFAHESSDGTPAMQRIARFYDSPASENIAWGTSIDPRRSVLEMWMCSTTGHRGNIMSDSWEELGTGVVGNYYTQNFGNSDITLPAISMGAHWEEGSRVVFRADAFDADGVPPTRVEVVVNGEALPMELEVGAAERGIYKASPDAASFLETDTPGCSEYYFQATWGTEEDETARVERFPETGSYGFGSCLYVDEDAGWLARQLEPDDGKGGCSTTSTPAGLGLVGGLLGLLLLGRRRRA